MTEVTVSARIPREMEREVEDLMREEDLEKSAALRKILHIGLEGYRRERALRLLSQRRITLSKAAKIAKVSVWEMLSLAGDRHITWVDDDLMEDLRGHPSVRRS
jgi:predicted HTH domain antitoxin